MDEKENEVVKTFNHSVVEAYRLLSSPLVGWEPSDIVSHEARVEELFAHVSNMRGAVRAAKQLEARGA